MTEADRRLVDIFMKAQAEPEGRIFSENVLAGLKAVLAFAPPEELAQIKSEAEAYVTEVGNARNAWAALKAHIGSDIIPGSRFERLIWLMDAAVGAPSSPRGTP